MEEDLVDPSTINKSPVVLKAAVEDVNKLDVLVCGRCLRVCHFVEEFKLHKITECSGGGKDIFDQAEREKREGAVENTWAFLLWKNAQHSNSSLSTLTLYQQWKKLPDDRKDAWMIAGQSIQRFKILSQAKIQGVQHSETVPLSKVKPQLHKVVIPSKESTKVESKNVVQQLLKRVVQTLPVKKSDGQQKKKLPVKRDPGTTQSNTGPPLNDSPEDIEDTSLIMSPSREEKLLREEFEEANGSLDAEQKVNGEQSSKLETDNANKVHHNTETTYDELPEIKTEIVSDVENRSVSDKEDTENRPPLLKMPSSQNNSNLLSRRVMNKAPNTGDSSEDEYVVEKILAKRYNPRKKHFEYLLKWEGYPHDQNTWEPVQNMQTCVELVKTFEQNLAKQRAAQEQQKKLVQSNFTADLKPQTKADKFLSNLKVETSGGSPSDVSSSGRPVRNSKKRALGKMKTWCGSIGREDDETGGKRKAMGSSDSEDSMTSKKIKLEPEDDYDNFGMDDSGNESSEDDKGVLWHQRSANLPQNRLTNVSNIILKGDSSGIRKLPLPGMKNSMNGMTSKNEENHENDLAKQLGLESPTKSDSEMKLGTHPPVLVANSKGVVKVDPSQLPNLTSGVYIVNKTGGGMKGKVTTGDHKPSSDLSSESTGNKEQVLKDMKSTKSGLVLNPAAIAAMSKKPLSQSNRPKLSSPGCPRVLGPRPAATVGPRSATTGPRPKLLGPRLESNLRVKLLDRLADPSGKLMGGLHPRSSLTGKPRPSLIKPSLSSGAARPGLAETPGSKKPVVGIPGVQTKITSAVKPRTPGQKTLSPLSAQSKSGVKPIQAMLGGVVAPMTPLAELAAAKRAARLAGVQNNGLQKKGVKLDAGRGRGRGRGNHVEPEVGKKKESILADTDGVHMEFHQEVSDSESDDNLPDISLEDLPPIEPPSPPRPFTLCPLTGKVLGKAEGEHTPLPSPERSGSPLAEVVSEEILPDLKGAASPMHVQDDGETLLKVEMSPGGTTTKVVRRKSEGSGSFGITEGAQRLTVTKIPDDPKNPPEVVRSSVQIMKSAGGGISVPATKLPLGSSELSTELVTMGDGVVYQISKEECEAIEGGQHCVFVTTEPMEDGEESNMLTLNTAVAEAVAHMGSVPKRLIADRSGSSQFYVRESEPSDELVMATVVDSTDVEGNGESELVTHMVRQGEIIPGTRVILQTEDGSSVVYSQEVEADTEGNVVAHIVDGEVAHMAVDEEEEDATHDAKIVGNGEINPETGKRRVLLLLPNGTLVMTEVEGNIVDDDEQQGLEKGTISQYILPSKEYA